MGENISISGELWLVHVESIYTKKRASFQSVTNCFLVRYSFIEIRIMHSFFMFQWEKSACYMDSQMHNYKMQLPGSSI